MPINISAEIEIRKRLQRRFHFRVVQNVVVVVRLK